MRAPQRILVTGATGGLGAPLALAYAKHGNTLWLHGRREARLAELAQECERRGAQVHTRSLDVTHTEALMAWVQSLAPQVDLAIVNAGVTSNTRDGEGWPEIDRLLEVNVRAAFATVSALVPAMQQRGAGQIALMSSVAAWYGMPVTPAYCASKAAIKAYGEAMRGWLAPDGVQVSVVMPGFVRTPMSDRFPAPKPFMLSAEDAAQRIVRGLARNQARIGFPFPVSTFMWALAALPPALSARLLRLAGYAR